MRRDALLLGAALPLWCALVLAGLVVLERYASGAGPLGVAPSTWPADSALRREEGRPTLVVLAHPRCPCTRATLNELARLLARAPGAAAAWVVLSRPDVVDDDWARTDLLRTAEATPGVRPWLDRGDRERDRFGARTSGTVLLYDAGGQLAFAGGITAGRGHEGDNAGASALLALLRGGAPEIREAPVFGCALRAPAGTGHEHEEVDRDGCGCGDDRAR